MPFPISGQLVLSLYLSPFSRYLHFPISGSRSWPFGVHDVIGHVTNGFPSSHYRCSIVTKCVSPAVFEIFVSIVPDQCKASMRMRDITWPVPPMQNLGTYFNFSPPHCSIHYDTFIGLQWRLRGVYSWDPNVKREIQRKFCPDQNGANFGGLWGLGVRGFKKFRFLLQKARPCVNPRRLSNVASKSVEGSDLQVGWGKLKSERLPVGVPLLREEFRQPKLTFHSDLQLWAASRRALPYTSYFSYEWIAVQLNIQFSKGSVATDLSWGGRFGASCFCSSSEKEVKEL